MVVTASMWSALYSPHFAQALQTPVSEVRLWGILPDWPPGDRPCGRWNSLQSSRLVTMVWTR